MKSPDSIEPVEMPNETILGRILVIRGRRVMLDRDLAGLYGVSTKALNQAAKRNQARFPSDFMFQLDLPEFENWKSQFVTSKKDRQGLRKTPFAFTEQGVAMLSSVLKSPRAIAINIQIMRAFIEMREMIGADRDLARKIERIEEKYDLQFKTVFEVIKRLIREDTEPKKSIGFDTPRRSGPADSG